jgi:hypothetical protein
MVVARIGFVAGQVNLACEHLRDCLISVLVRMEAGVVKELPYRHLVALGSVQTDPVTEVPVVHPASQPDSDHRIHAALESILWCIFGRF